MLLENRIDMSRPGRYNLPNLDEEENTLFIDFLPQGGIGVAETAAEHCDAVF